MSTICKNRLLKLVLSAFSVEFFHFLINETEKSLIDFLTKGKRKKGAERTVITFALFGVLSNSVSSKSPLTRPSRANQQPSKKAIHSTPDNSNLLGKPKNVRVIGSLSGARSR